MSESTNRPDSTHNHVQSQRNDEDMFGIMNELSTICVGMTPKQVHDVSTLVTKSYHTGVNHGINTMSNAMSQAISDTLSTQGEKL